jgi:predicted nucleotidyltransferase component of viral defense system
VSFEEASRMKLSRRYIQGLATETGFREETLEKVLRLGEVVADISRHPLLSSVLALKGGTALNLCFSAPRRLSVDLDFNYIGAEEPARMREDRPAIEEALQHLARGRGYEIQASRDEHAGRKFFLNYESSAGARDRIEVDLNFLGRVPMSAACGSQEIPNDRACAY